MPKFFLSFVVTILSVTVSPFFTQTALAAAPQTPYNALAQTLSSNTTKGVYNAESDNIQLNKSIQGTIRGINGSTFLVYLPDEDSGYNVLITRETVIRLNGKTTTKKSLAKGKTVTVTGNLDESTYTFSAATIDIGTPIIKTASIAPISVPVAETTVITEQNLETTPVAKESKHISRTLKLGNKNADVKILQEKLVTLGFLSKGSATGYYGSQTVKAVKAFQKAHKLDQVGSVGPKTLTLLNT